MKSFVLMTLLCASSLVLSAQSTISPHKKDNTVTNPNFMKSGVDRTELTLISDMPRAMSMEEISDEVTRKADFLSFEIDQCLSRHKLVVNKMKSLQNCFGDFLDVFSAQPLWDTQLEADWNDHILNHTKEKK